MKKPALAYVAACNEERLTSMFKRQKALWSKPVIDNETTIIPFDVVPHQHYTLGEAHKLNTILNLIDNGGIEQVEACYATQAIDALPIHPLDYQPGFHGTGDLWIGVGTVVRRNDDHKAKFKVCGTFEELLVQKDKEMSGEFQGYDLVRFVTTNVSLSARFVRQRAIELGLPEGEDDTQGSHAKRREKSQ